MSDKETGFSQNLTDIVSVLNKELLKQGRLSTDPYMLNFHSYDCVNLETGEPPRASMCRFTISGLLSILPLFDIQMGDDERIIVEGQYFGDYTAYPTKNHIEYINEIAMQIISKYDGDETKLPRNMYQWYYKDKDFVREKSVAEKEMDACRYKQEHECDCFMSCYYANKNR